ncbi:MAG: hypothetical protein ABR529_06195 [Actinomycetota bacterium]
MHPAVLYEMTQRHIGELTAEAETWRRAREAGAGRPRRARVSRVIVQLIAGAKGAI